MMSLKNLFQPSPDASSRTGPKAWNVLWQMLETPASRLHLAAGALLLLTLTLAVYQPILPGNFLMDDWRLIDTDNGLSNGSVTISNIWFQTDFTLSYIALWLQWLAWGTNPGWYHVVNLLLHATSCVLIWRLLAKMKIPGAWLAAALFAVHPVCVNSVARIAEVKNTLSLPFFLASLWAYFQYEGRVLYPASDESQRPGQRATGWYVLALLAFIAALMSKTSVVMLPPVLTACAWWQRRRINRNDWLHTAPFFALAMMFGLMSIWFQKHQALEAANETVPQQSVWQHAVLAGHVISFYLGKALWPTNLNLVYPRWKLDAIPLLYCLPYFIAGASLVWLWCFPASRMRHALFGLGCFAITLFPVLGLFDSQFLTVWQVSDHLQYLPLIAPVALVAAGISSLRAKSIHRFSGAALILILSIAAHQRAAVFSGEEKLLQDSIAKNPAASESQNDLGVILAKKKDRAGALKCFQAAVQSDPSNASARSNLGRVLALAGNAVEAEAQYRAVLKLKPFDVEAQKNYAQLLRNKGRAREAAYHYLVAVRFKPDVQTRIDLASLFYQTGNTHGAMDQYLEILKVKPDEVEALNNLAC